MMVLPLLVALLLGCPTCPDGAHFCLEGESDSTTAVTWCCWDDAGGVQ